jgi:hypothetical protein
MNVAATSLWPIISDALLYGAVLSAILVVLLLAVLWIDPEFC